MKKFLNILDGEEIILEKLNKFNNEYYLIKSIHNKLKRLSLKEMFKKSVYSEVIEFNAYFLKECDQIEFDNEYIIFKLHETNKKIKYPGLKVNSFYILRINKNLFEENDLKLIKSYKKKEKKMKKTEVNKEELEKQFEKYIVQVYGWWFVSYFEKDIHPNKIEKDIENLLNKNIFPKEILEDISKLKDEKEIEKKLVLKTKESYKFPCFKKELEKLLKEENKLNKEIEFYKEVLDFLLNYNSFSSKDIFIKLLEFNIIKIK